MSSSSSAGRRGIPLPLWIDTDPSGLVWTGLDCDDDLAILAALALHRHEVVDLQGISICGGNAPLRHTWLDIQRLLKHAGWSKDLAVLKGYGWKSLQVAVRLLKIFHYFAPDVDDSNDALSALVERSRSPSPPMNILTLGPVTNLARALQGGLDPSGIAHIYIMGGEMTGQPLDLNFRSDRAAARLVIEADIPKTIVTIQTCGQTAVTKAHVDLLDCPRNAACILLPKMKQQIMVMPKVVNSAVKKRFLEDGSGAPGRWNPSPNLDRGFIPWDVVALLAATHPEEFGEWEHHRVAIPPCDKGEPCDGSMRVVEDLGTSFDSGNWSGVVRTPHLVRNETRLLELMFSLLDKVPAASAEEQPLMLMGLVSDLAGLAMATALFAVAFIFHILRR